MAKKQSDPTFSDALDIHLTIKDKQKAARAWARFLESNFDRKEFTKQLYRVLNTHFGYPAFYDLDQFYEYFFGKDAEDRTSFFLRDFRNHIFEMKRYWSWSSILDLAEEMILRLDQHEPRLVESIQKRRRNRDMSDLEWLAEKLGYDLVEKTT